MKHTCIQNPFRVLSLGVASAGLMLNCAAPQMAVPGRIAETSEVIEAKDRSMASGALVDEGFQLGRYSISEVDRDWNSESGFSAGPFSDKKATTGYAYQVSEGKSKLKGTCGSETNTQSIFGGGGSQIAWGSTTVACTCEGADQDASLTWSGENSEISVAGRSYDIKPIHETAEGNNMSEPVGFSAGSKELLGAVEVTHPGRVWLNKELSEQAKAGATCLFVGLMLYQPSKDD